MIHRPIPLVLLLVLMATLWAGAVQARGFLWEARKGEARVLLMGTIHVGRAEQGELTPAQGKALRDAAVLALEADVLDAQRVLTAYQRYALYAEGAPGLEGQLSAAQRSRVQKTAVRYRLPVDRALRMKPWALANTLVLLEAARLGLSPAYASEVLLTAQARAAGKPIVEIESVEQQLALFDSAPVPVQVAYLEQALDSIDDGEGEREVIALLDAWLKGDAEAMLARLTKMQATSNAGERWIAEQVLDARHAQMLNAIERFAASGKLHLVAVGTLHFFGDNGLLQLLRERGYTITRLP